MHNYRELQVWVKSRGLVKEVYEITKNFPDNERFGLISQMRRSAISIPSNFAEGSGRKTDKGFANFLSIALGSSFELETQCWLSLDQGFIKEGAVNEVIKQVKRFKKCFVVSETS